MSSKQFAQYVDDLLSGMEDVRSIPMMGGYVYYYRNRIFGGIYHDTFMVKLTDVSRRYMPDSEAQHPYEGSTKLMLPVTLEGDRDALYRMIEEMYPELPEPPKKRKPAQKYKEAKA